MKLSEFENCPNCDSILPLRLATGRVVCKKCGWSDQPKNRAVSNEMKEEVTNSEATHLSVPSTLLKQTPSRANVRKGKTFTHGFGLSLFIVGSTMMGIGLVYDSTVASGVLSLDRTYNIGAISNKSTYTNTGGFLAVCGAIFITSPRRHEEESKRE